MEHKPSEPTSSQTWFNQEKIYSVIAQILTGIIACAIWNVSRFASKDGLSKI